MRVTGILQIVCATACDLARALGMVICYVNVNEHALGRPNTECPHLLRDFVAAS